MAKISPVSIKYMIYGDFEADGTVEKPDVIGALFGQTEGLLGSDLEMRELQKEGKIGRIEVNLETNSGKTLGKIHIPSALDKTETTLIAAAIETIDRIGPSVAKIIIEKIEDVRENKRDYILERAKKLLEAIEEKAPKTKEISENIKLGARENKLQEYGEEKLPSGDIEGKEMIIVEGRADVINLLRNGIYNVIGMNGTKLPESIKELSLDKEVTLFVDGDRGGRLIAKNLIDNARVDFIAIAPDGKEVEELSGKEILSALRKKITVKDFLRDDGDDKRGRHFYRNEDRGYSRDFRHRDSRDMDHREHRDHHEHREIRETREEPMERKEVKIKDEDKSKLSEFLGEVENTKSVMVLDSNLEKVKKTALKNLFTTIIKMRNLASVLVVDTANQNVVKAAEDSGISTIIAKNFTFSGDTNVKLVSL